MNPKFQSNHVLSMKTAQWLAASVAIIVLTACGGGSSGSFDAGREARVSITAMQTSIEAAAFECRPSTQVNVRFVNANGTSVADGTVVSLSSSNSANGTVDSLQGSTPGGSATATTSGGTAQFRFFSGTQPGSVTLTASGDNPSGVGSVTATQVITVISSSCQEPQPPQLQVIPLASSIESNPTGLAPNPNAPYTVQVNVSFRNGDGTIVPNGTEVTLTSASAALGVISPLDSPATAGGSATVPTAGGVASFWVTSGGSTGTLTLTASAADPREGETGTITASASVSVVESSGTFGPQIQVIPLSSTVESNPTGLEPNPAAPYTVQVNVDFRLSNGEPVPDGTSVNLASGSSAVGVVSPLDAPGQAGGVATSQTSGGVARFWFTSATQTGDVTLTASATNPEEPGTVSGSASIRVLPSTGAFGPKLEVIPLAGSVEANPRGLVPNPAAPYTVQVNVDFRLANGQPVPDGTSVNLASGSSAVGVVSPLDAPGQTGGVAVAQTSGGVARFWFTSATQTGTVTLTASADNPGEPGTVLGFGSVQVVNATDSFRASLLVAPVSNSVEANPRGLGWSAGAPYTVQVNVIFRQANGDFVADGTLVRLRSGSAAVGVVSPGDNPTDTGIVAESVTAAGTASFWFTSGTETGTVTLAASAENPDPQDSNLITGSGALQVVPASSEFDSRIEVVPLSRLVEANPQGLAPNPGAAFTVQIDVNFTLPDGAPVADGTPVRLRSGNVAAGLISPIDDPQNTSSVVESATVGGTASFWFTSASTLGFVTLTASADNPVPDEEGTITGSTAIEIIEASDATGRLTVLGDTTMPTNRLGVPIFLGSPYINELTVRYRGPDGQPGQVQDGRISVAVSPVSVGAFSTLDDPDTPENEFLILVGSGPVNMTAGTATIFIHSFDRPGQLNVTIQAVDAGTDERFSTNFVIDVEDGAADFLPADLFFTVSPDPVYTQGSGGPTTKQLTLTVLDSGGNPVPNPEAEGNSFNNVRLILDAPPGSGARLTGTSVSGSVTGSEIDIRTVNGVANFALNAGSVTGNHRITAIVDRADNNVDNDLQDPLSAQTTISVGDGRLFALQLVSPILNAIRVNATTTGIETSFEPTIDPVTGAFVPPDPDGTYSLTVTAVATDQAGNPPLPTQPLSFGKVDAPTTPEIPREFVFSGPDGDPEEGGFQFTAENPAEGFLNNPGAPNEAVEPGDTLALFGKVVPGNREHEASRFVSSVISNNELTVSERFNPNNGVDNGPVIPWVIGRSQVGFVDSSLVLNAQGRGSVQLTYPINALGDPLVLWVQGNRLQDGTNRTVADVEALLFPGVAPLLLTASPSVVPGNTSVPVRLCVTDGLRAPIRGLFVSGSVTGGGITGSLDGSPLPAFTATATGTTAQSGCLVTQLSTSGLIPDGEPGEVTFVVGEASATVEVAPPGAALLTVEPSQEQDNLVGEFERLLTLTLLNPQGDPITGVGLVGECDGGEGDLVLIQAPGVTNASGQTTARVLINMAGCGETDPDPDNFPRFGQCVFSTNTGEPVGLFTAIGRDLRPLIPGACPPLDDDDD